MEFYKETTERERGRPRGKDFSKKKHKSTSNPLNIFGISQNTRIQETFFLPWQKFHVPQDATYPPRWLVDVFYHFPRFDEERAPALRSPSYSFVTLSIYFHFLSSQSDVGGGCCDYKLPLLLHSIPGSSVSSACVTLFIPMGILVSLFPENELLSSLLFDQLILKWEEKVKGEAQTAGCRQGIQISDLKY